MFNIFCEGTTPSVGHTVNEDQDRRCGVKVNDDQDLQRIGAAIIGEAPLEVHFRRNGEGKSDVSGDLRVKVFVSASTHYNVFANGSLSISNAMKEDDDNEKDEDKDLDKDEGLSRPRHDSDDDDNVQPRGLGTTSGEISIGLEGSKPPLAEQQPLTKKQANRF
ncbi:hypothetical protein L7F22_023837 [Adiantum nelumboides]|nr:hypothetical protein [Adiantum nelumboides]